MPVGKAGHGADGGSSPRAPRPPTASPRVQPVRISSARSPRGATSPVAGSPRCPSNQSLQLSCRREKRDPVPKMGKWPQEELRSSVNTQKLKMVRYLRCEGQAFSLKTSRRKPKPKPPTPDPPADGLSLAFAFQTESYV
mmetsp:Transcript_118832/g.206964  ORF Transcript_118832/g.206964 Transcript_118832/m.206964 type:complete len:139 (-) Transcript_118832:317-733(-)